MKYDPRLDRLAVATEDILETAKNIAEKNNTTTETALEAMKVAAMLDIDETICSTVSDIAYQIN